MFGFGLVQNSAHAMLPFPPRSFRTPPISEMLSSSFHFRKTKSAHRDYYERKLTGRHRFRDLSHIKLSDIFKPLRRRGFRADVSHRSSLTHSLTFPPPFTDYDSSPAQPPSLDLSTSSSHHISSYQLDAVSLLRPTEECIPSEMSSPSFPQRSVVPDAERRYHVSQRPGSALSTSPLTFNLRSASTDNYSVERLEDHLRRLSLGDANQDLPKDTSRGIPMDICPESPSVSPHRTSASSNSSTQKSALSPHDQNIVPMIVITSVDAKHAKPLPPSPQRLSRTPFGPSDLTNHLTNVLPTKPDLKTIPDDPFMTQPCGAVYPPDYNLTFRLPSFPSAYSSPAKCVPDTPTPMCCDHVGDCRGDLWEILHPPLVPHAFTLPPFKLPPLSTDIFNDVPVTLQC